MLERIDYLFIRKGLRHAELKRVWMRPLVYGFCAVSLAAGLALAALILVNLSS